MKLSNNRHYENFIMRFLSLASATLTLIAASSNGLYAQDALSCINIPNSEERLDCYDQAFASSNELNTPTLGSDWNVRTDTSPLDDSPSVYLSVQSKSPIMGRYGSLVYGSLNIRCFEHTTSVYTIWGDHFMSDYRGGGRVHYRIDDNPAAFATMRESSDNKALGLWTEVGSLRFIERMFGGNSIYMRASPYNESPVEMIFNITGLEEAIEPLREACGW